MLKSYLSSITSGSIAGYDMLKCGGSGSGGRAAEGWWFEPSHSAVVSVTLVCFVVGEAVGAD